jgi:hypothetical protein
MTEFEAITSQEQFDERIKSRLARERERWEKESGVEDLRAQLQAKDEEIAGVHASYKRQALEDHARNLMAARGVDENRAARAFRMLDFDDAESGQYNSPERAIEFQLSAIATDVPELLKRTEFALGSGTRIRGTDRPVLKREKEMTAEDLEHMSETEINQHWDEIQKVLAQPREQA